MLHYVIAYYNVIKCSIDVIDLLLIYIEFMLTLNGSRAK